MLITIMFYTSVAIAAFRLLHIYPTRLPPIPPPPTAPTSPASSPPSLDPVILSLALTAIDEDPAPDLLSGECLICLEGFSPGSPKQRVFCSCGVNKSSFHEACLERCGSERGFVSERAP
jgi:hypothetical protein